MNYNLCILKYAVLVLMCVTIFIFTTSKNTFARTNFHMERPRLGLEFLYNFNNEEQTGPDINFQSERHEFRERLSIESTGWIYHPALCEYVFDFRPEWGQRMEEINTEKGSKNAFLQGYYLKTTFLPYKPYSLALFGRRQNIPSLSSFSQVSDTDIDIYGANLNFSYPVLPTSLSYTHSEEEQTGFYNSQDKSDSWRLLSSHRKGNSNTQLNATYEERMHTTSGFTSDIDTLYSNISNTYELEERKIRFRSYLSQRLTDQNTLKTSAIGFNEDIDWEHRENLTTFYDFSYGKNTSGDIFNETKNIGAGLSHRLYENLNTIVSGNITDKEFTGGSENSYIGDLKFDYVRPIPYGTLGANMGFNYRLRSSTFDEEFIPVIDEPHILTGIAFSFLDNKFIDIGSIKVTNIDRTRVYINNLDYEIDEINFFVRIRRLIGSGIADGEQVLVSYRYLSTTSSFDDSTFVQSYGFNLDLLSKLFLSYRYQHSKQKILSGIPPDEPQDDTVHTAEIELLWRFTDTIFSYENADRTAGNSIETWRVNEVLTFRPAPNLFFKMTGTLGHSEFKKGIEEIQDSYGFGFIIDWIPVTWGKLGLSGSHYALSGDSVKTEDTAITVNLEMSYSIWNGSLKYSYLLRKDDIDDVTRQINNIIFEIVKVNF